MTKRRTRNPYRSFNFRVAIAPLLAVVGGFVGIKVASAGRTADKRANGDAAFMRRLRRAIEFPRPRRGRKTEPGINALLLDRLGSGGIGDAAAVDQLLAGSRTSARHTLGLQTLAQTDRLLSALRIARNDMGEDVPHQ